MKFIKVTTANGKQISVNLEGLRTASSFEFAKPNEQTGKKEFGVKLVYQIGEPVFLTFETLKEADSLIDRIQNS